MYHMGVVDVLISAGMHKCTLLEGFVDRSKLLASEFFPSILHFMSFFFSMRSGIFVVISTLLRIGNQLFWPSTTLGVRLPLGNLGVENIKK